MSDTSVIDPTHVDRLAELAVKTGLALKPGQGFIDNSTFRSLASG